MQQFVRLVTGHNARLLPPLGGARARSGIVPSTCVKFVRVEVATDAGHEMHFVCVTCYVCGRLSTNVAAAIDSADSRYLDAEGRGHHKGAVASTCIQEKTSKNSSLVQASSTRIGMLMSFVCCGHLVNVLACMLWTKCSSFRMHTGAPLIIKSCTSLHPEQLMYTLQQRSVFGTGTGVGCVV